MKQDQETLGRYLRREREARHVTVEEIALFVGVKRSLAEALEADDFDSFPERSECLRLVRQYTAYLNLNRTEVVRRFDGQWRKSSHAKRYPKLTHFTDRDEFREKRAGFAGKKLFTGLSPARMGWLVDHRRAPDRCPLPFHVSSREDTGVPAAGAFAAVPGRGTGGSRCGTDPAPHAVDVGIRDVAPRRTPAIDPLYSPPGRSARNPVPPPAVTAGIKDGGENPHFFPRASESSGIAIRSDTTCRG